MPETIPAAQTNDLNELDEGQKVLVRAFTRMLNDNNEQLAGVLASNVKVVDQKILSFEARTKLIEAEMASLREQIGADTSPVRPSWKLAAAYAGAGCVGALAGVSVAITVANRRKANLEA